MAIGLPMVFAHSALVGDLRGDGAGGGSCSVVSGGTELFSSHHATRLSYHDFARWQSPLALLLLGTPIFAIFLIRAVANIRVVPVGAAGSCAPPDHVRRHGELRVARRSVLSIFAGELMQRVASRDA